MTVRGGVLILVRKPAVCGTLVRLVGEGATGQRMNASGGIGGRRSAVGEGQSVAGVPRRAPPLPLGSNCPSRPRASSPRAAVRFHVSG